MKININGPIREICAPALPNALAMASAQRCTSTPLVLAMEVVAPAGLNPFDGATNWVLQPG